MSITTIHLALHLNTKEAIATTDATSLRQTILGHLNTNQKVQLDFGGMTLITRAFLNELLGQLQLVYPSGKLIDQLRLVNLGDHEALVNRVIEQAKEYQQAISNPWPYVRLEGNWTEGFTPTGPYPTFDDAVDSDPAASWVMKLQPASTPPAVDAAPNYVVLVGNPSDGITAHGPYPTREAAVEDVTGQQYHDTWVTTLTAPNEAQKGTTQE